MNFRIAALGAAAIVLACATLSHAANRSVAKSKHSTSEAVSPKVSDGMAEARLGHIYTLIASGQHQQALANARALAQDVPSFQLAQLVYADLLQAHVGPLRAMGDAPTGLVDAAGSALLSELREESLRRMTALRDRPAAGTVPAQFLTLSQRSKHAIAVDTSRSRLYLFENTPSGLSLLADYYLSVGKAGTSKTAEGDQRTPLGVYYISSNLDRKSLKDFYGAGALPINYPNVLDTKRGKTGSGIWLHGTPPNQFSRPPQATDGCLVLANPDLERIIQTVEVRTTPVVIATRLQWVPLHSVKNGSKPFEDALLGWRNAKTAGDVQQVLAYYTSDFSSNGKTLAQWLPTLKSELAETQGRTIQLKDLSYLRWVDTADTMVVTFGEVAEGIRTGWTKRQYWVWQDNRWKIFFEGIM